MSETDGKKVKSKKRKPVIRVGGSTRLRNPVTGGHTTKPTGKGSVVIGGLRFRRPSFRRGNEHNKSKGGGPRSTAARLHAQGIDTKYWPPMDQHGEPVIRGGRR